MTAFSLPRWVEPRRGQIDAYLLSRFGDAIPDVLQTACRYPLGTGGKRMRPLLTFAAHEALGGSTTAHTLWAGCAVEMVHGYSLVHDDLPAMDNDDERRGKPTTHKVYGDNGAILVGDAMLTDAFGILAQLPGALCARLVGELAQAAGHAGMIGGQALDIGMGGMVQDLDTLTQLHRAKTGALIRCAVRFGAHTAAADPTQLAALTQYGEAVGLAFQLADDVLDEEQDAGDDGPPSFVRLLGVTETQRRATALLNEALDAISTLPNPAPLEALARFTVERDH